MQLSGPVTLQLGLPARLREDAARLYWQAFGGKLGRVMGPDAKALRFLQRVIRDDQVFIALDEHGQLLGLAGFKTPNGGFASGDWADMRAVYGSFGMLWRASLLSLLSRDIDNDRFLLDGLCVTSAARNRGIGSALLAAIEDEARSRGYAHVRLDVVNTNWRARALYERLGYKLVMTDKIGLLRFVFGFDAADTLVKAV